jgi:hypothetical protein
MNVIEIMEIFNLGLIGKVVFIITSFTIGLKRPVHRGSGV